MFFKSPNSGGERFHPSPTVKKLTHPVGRQGLGAPKLPKYSGFCALAKAVSSPYPNQL